MKSKRKIRRNRDKQAKKSLEKGIKQVTKDLDKMPDGCTSCGVKFNPKTDLDSWYIEVSENIILTCRACSE